MPRPPLTPRIAPVSKPEKQHKPRGGAAFMGTTATSRAGNRREPSIGQSSRGEQAQANALELQKVVDSLDLPSQPFTGDAKTIENKRRVLTALVKSLNIVSTACANAGVSRPTFYRYVQSDPAFAQMVTTLHEYTMDFVEQRLYNLIQKGDTAATIFFLKTRAKTRGYVERTELTGANGGPMATLNMTMEDAKQEIPPGTLADIYASLLSATGHSTPSAESSPAAMFARGMASPKKKKEAREPSSPSSSK